METNNSTRLGATRALFGAFSGNDNLNLKSYKVCFDRDNDLEINTFTFEQQSPEPVDINQIPPMLAEVVETICEYLDIEDASRADISLTLRSTDCIEVRVVCSSYTYNND